MKAMYSVGCILLLAVGCDAPAENSGEEEIVVPSPRTPTEGTAPPAAVPFTGRDLEGTWKRVDYPFGTIEFRGDEVKINVGEGMAEPPSFQRYELSDRCPASGQPLAADDQRALVHGDNLCDVLSVSRDTLRQSDAAGSYSIVFVKQD